MSGVKAAGFAGLLRTFVVALDTQRLEWQPIVYVLAVFTLLVGTSILAVVQTDVKRMMAYSSISHAGFILVAVQAANEPAAAALFYLAVYTFMIGSTFGIITLVGRRGDDRHDLDDYRAWAR